MASVCIYVTLAQPPDQCLSKPMHETYTPHQVGQLLGVNSYTVRRWCADYADHLSASAKPDKGGSRRLTEHDVEVLREVQKMRSEGLQTPAINERLADVVFSAPIIEASQTALEGQTQALVLIEALRSTDARLTALEQAQQAIAPASVVVAEVVERTAAQMREDIMNEVRAEIEQQLQPIAAQRLRVDVVWVAVAALTAGLIVGLSVWWFGG
jgi:DNA-binding transcriptional MerR regulator